jgi:hypothetical protein
MGGSAPFPKPVPPGTLAPLLDAIGEDALVLLLEKRGGTQINIRERLSPHEGLGAELGLDQAACDRMQPLASHKFRVPLCRPYLAKLYKWRGLSYTQIALKLRVTDRAVWGILHDAGMTNAGQMTLGL